MSNWQLEYYQTTAGRSRVREYLEALDDREAARVAFDLDLLAEFGLELRAPYVRNLGGKLWELRTRGRAQHRVLYFAATGRRLVLLHAFTKKTPQTPRGEIATALRRLEDYQARM